MALSSVSPEHALNNPDGGADAVNILNLRINGCAPCLTHADAVNDRLSEAHAILLLMSQAYDGADDAQMTGQSMETIEVLSHRIVARALDGVASLIAYAQHHINAEKEA